MPSAFVDTNILVYAAHEVSPLLRKTVIARELLRQSGLCFSVQVLSEFTVTARSPRKLNFTPEQEWDWIRRWLLFEVLPLSVDTFTEALVLHARYQLSHWDSLIIASAQEAGCQTVFSEDMASGQRYGEVTVVNPFSTEESA